MDEYPYRARLCFGLAQRCSPRSLSSRPAFPRSLDASSLSVVTVASAASHRFDIVWSLRFTDKIYVATKQGCKEGRGG